MRVDGAPVERLLDVAQRPLVSVFLPDRLELIKGAPAVRRAHLDQFVAALWPARAATRRAYAQALAQRNALIARIRAGAGVARVALPSWDPQLARHGIELMARPRARRSAALAEPFAELGDELGLDGEPSVAYRPRSRGDRRAGAGRRARASDSRAISSAASPATGPHRDELVDARASGRELRAYGSQGQQRLGAAGAAAGRARGAGARRATRRR